MADNNFKDSLKYPRVYSNPEQRDIQEKLTALLDEYEKSNSFENREFLCYLTAAIFLTYKKLYPQLSIYIPFRTKSDTSYIKNVQKEFIKFMTNTDSQDPFNTTPILKDVSGFRIVLDNINFSLPSTEESRELFNDPEIKKLLGNIDDEDKNKNEKKYTRRENLNFADKVDNYTQSPIRNGKQYFELKKELLERIVKITPPEFTEERKPHPSFSQLYEEVKYQYDYFLKNDSFPTMVSNLQINELNDLLNKFRGRIDDQLHFAILRKTLPIVLEDPLIKNVLKTSFQWDKEALKPNRFQARYDTLYTPFGPVELQSQSNEAYYEATKGSAYHSGLDGKDINVKDFFELVDPNDEHELSYYLDILDSISADSMISPYELPEFKTEQERNDFLKTSKGIAYLQSEKYREMMTHIQFKSKMQILPQHLPPEVYDANNKINSKKLQELIDCGTVKTFSMDTNGYLFSTALALSPYMNVCSSGHTSFTTAGIHHKKVIGEFSEILRKKDSNTCLRDLLIRRLEQLIENPEIFLADMDESSQTAKNIKRCLKIVQEHDEIALKLPKDISLKNILNYGEKLRNMEKSHPNFAFTR